MTFTLVIIHWNTPELLEQQLTALHDLKHGEVIVIDNASSVSIHLLEESFPRVKFIYNQINKGFSFACNQGLSQATGNWVMFLNSDVEIDEPRIENMIRFVEEKNLVAASPDFSNDDYKKPIPSFWSLFVEFTPLSTLISLSEASPLTLVGGCLLIKKTTLLGLQGWDERFFLWFEDSDLSKRLVEQKLPFELIKDTGINHIGGTSLRTLTTQEQRTIFFLSLRLYAEKYFSGFGRNFLSAMTQKFSSNKLLPSDPKITASIVVPNQTNTLLEKFLQHNYQYFDFSMEELIVVSSAEISWDLKMTYPETIFIHSKQRLGFAAAVNLGLKRSRGLYLGTVNDDVTLEKNWLKKLVAHFEDSTASLSPLILNRSGEVESLGINVLPFGRAERLREIALERNSDTFNGACVIFCRKALEEVGLFDENFQSYLEDIDLGLRFKKAGWINKTVSQVKVLHLGQQTSHDMGAQKNFLDFRNWWLVMIKNFPISHWFQHLLPIFLERGRNLSGWLKARN